MVQEAAEPLPLGPNEVMLDISFAEEAGDTQELQMVQDAAEPLPLGPNEVMLDISFAEEAKAEVRGEATILAPSLMAGKQAAGFIERSFAGPVVAAAEEVAGEGAIEEAEDDGFVYIEDSGVPIPEFNPFETEGYAAKLELHHMRVARVLAEEQELYEKDLEQALAEASAGPSPWHAPARAGRRAMQALRAARMQEEEQDLYAKDGEVALAASIAADPNPWQHDGRKSRREMQTMRAVQIQVEEESLEAAASSKALEDAIAGPSPWMDTMTAERNDRSKMQAMRAERAHTEARNLYLAACRTAIRTHGRKVVRTVWL